MPYTNPLWLISQAPKDLKAQIRIAVSHGYHVTSQTEKTAQLVRPKKFSIGAALLWLFVFGVGIILYFLYYLSKSDEAIYLDVDTQASAEELTKLPKPKQMSRGKKIALGIVGVWLFCSILTSFAMMNSKKTDGAATSHYPISPEEQRATLKDRLTKDLAEAKAYKTNMDAFGYDVPNGVKTTRETFVKWATDIKEGNASQDQETVKLSNSLAKEASRVQVALFPLMRKSYAERAANKLWVTDTKVRTVGAGNRTIIFTSSAFAANANKAEFEQTVEAVLINLRFAQVRYEWYEGSEYSYWDLSNAKDSDLVQ